MKKLNTLLILTFCWTFLYAQIWEDELTKKNKTATAQEKFEHFEKYRKAYPYIKGNGYKPYARERDFITKRITKNTVFKPNALYNEWKKELNNNKKHSFLVKSRAMSNSDVWHASGVVETIKNHRSDLQNH